MIKLKDLIIEGNDDCEELFGKYLFGQYKKFYGSEKEKDTEIESRTFIALLQWIESAGKRQQTARYLDDLMKCKLKYPKILQPKKSVYYRIMSFPSNHELVNKIKKIEYDALDDVDKFWKNDKNRNKLLKFTNFSMTYKPQYRIESWTTSKSSALKFAIGSMHVLTFPAYVEHGGGGATFIIKANLDLNDLILNPKFSNKLAVDAGWWPQNEVIRYSKNKKEIKVDAFYISLLPQVGQLQRYDIPKNVKSKIVGEIKSKWSSF